MNTASCLAHVRELAKKAESAAELVPWLTADVLTAAGWTVHTNRPKVFIGATKQDGANDLEIRVSVVNQTIGGSITKNARRQELSWASREVEAISSLLWEGIPPQPQIRISATHEINWRDVMGKI